MLRFSRTRESFARKQVYYGYVFSTVKIVIKCRFPTHMIKTEHFKTIRVTSEIRGKMSKTISKYPTVVLTTSSVDPRPKTKGFLRRYSDSSVKDVLLLSLFYVSFLTYLGIEDSRLVCLTLTRLSDQTR